MSRFTKARRETRRVEKLVGPTGMRPLPFHFWYDQLIKAGGTPSPEFKAAAEHARQAWAKILPTLPVLKLAPDAPKAPELGWPRGLGATLARLHGPPAGPDGPADLDGQGAELEGLDE